MNTAVSSLFFIFCHLLVRDGYKDKALDSVPNHSLFSCINHYDTHSVGLLEAKSVLDLLKCFLDASNKASWLVQAKV